MNRVFLERQNSYQIAPSKPAKPKRRVKFTDDLILHDDMKNHDIEDIRHQLSRASLKVDLNNIDQSGKTLLHEAVENEFFDIVNLLIEKKVDINQADENGYTPLHEACALGNYDMTKLLLDQGADTNVHSHDGARPYDLIEFNNLPLISLMLNHMTLDTPNEDKKQRKCSVKTLPEKQKQRRLTPTPSGSLQEYFEKNLRPILMVDNSNIDNLIEQINVICSNKHLKKCNEFIAALTTLICESTMQDTSSLMPKVNTEMLSKRLQIIHEFVVDNTTLELECLYAVQNFDFKLNNPIGNFRHFFDSLYYCKIIRKETFLMWKKEKNPHRPLKDHARSITLLKDFFNF